MGKVTCRLVRFCVGKHLANDSLFIMTARILWVASLKCALDENGKELPPDPNTFVDKGIITFELLLVHQLGGIAELVVCSHPAPYNCVIRPVFQKFFLSLLRKVLVLRIKARPVHFRYRENSFVLVSNCIPLTGTACV